MIERLRNAVLVLHWLSIDVALGTIVLMIFYARQLNVSLPLSIYFGIGLSVWLIYVVDRLLDVKNLSKPSSYRHRFYARNFKELSWMSILVLSAGLINVFFLPTVIFYFGIFLGTLVVIYLLIVHQLNKIWFKEIFVSVIFTMGIVLPPYLLSAGDLVFFQGLSMAQLFVLAMINLLIFAHFDLEIDIRDKFPSVAKVIGNDKTKILIIILIIISFILSGLEIYLTDNVFSVFLFMSIVLAMVFWKSNYFSFNDRYRFAADGIFFIPLISFF